MNLLSIALLALVALCLGFLSVFALARRLDNYGVVDIAWSYAFGLVAIGYAVATDGWFVRRFLLASIVVIWSLRLGTHLLFRVARHHPEEDRRYKELRSRWAYYFTPKMAGFFQLQALSVALLGLPFLLAAANPSPRFHPVEIIGIVVWLIAVSGETVADAQLSAFQRGRPHPSVVCNVGLWRYSRHPNYFFEWIIWLAYALIAVASPWGWLGFLSPAAILWLLLRVTGIPLTEEQSIRSKGDAYRHYQKTTNALVPWFPRTL